MIREPLHRVADGAAIDGAGANATEHVPEVQGLNGSRPVTGSVPTEADENASDGHDDPGPDLVDQESLERHQPRLGQDEDEKRELNDRQLRVVVRRQLRYAERPGVLPVRDRKHREYLQRMLKPTVRK